ncbi:MAG: nitroreductase family deazaflavin-dependent oxidoreductase [bacterium]|nr:nitroreductase family deazaflavin-dependent oxidoreductase [bacterium]MCP5068039.1 nitroreductase family deazaflavin-dependent oxidoreductase [bacterium]
MKVAAIAIGSLLALFGLSTWWALESSGVAIVETRAADSSLRSTHVWYAEPDGEIWLEAGTPTNPWYQDILAEPSITFSVDGLSRPYLAHPIAGPGGHEKIRELFRKKYGLRDWWIALLFAPSDSIAVRLTPQ